MTTRLTELTVGRILELQRGGFIGAVGKYQAVSTTFKSWVTSKNISTTAIFDAKLQEQLGDWLIIEKRQLVADYVNKKINADKIYDAQIALAKEFASIPVPVRMTRPPGAGGRSDPGGVVERGQSYYQGFNGNRAILSPESVEEALRTARATGNFNGLKNFIAKGEGNYDSVAGMIIGSPKYLAAIAGSTNVAVTPPTTTTQSNIPAAQTEKTLYIQKNYRDPFIKEGLVKSLEKAQQYFPSNPLTDQSINGECLLLSDLTSVQNKQTDKVKGVLENKLAAFKPGSKSVLVGSALFEMFPDDMRNKMSQNAEKDGVNPNYTHAWRAPGKISVTADIMIPGMSGFKIGQIFWVDRISEIYKQFGAFQLFGLTENINVSTGWTTSLRARFNVLPRRYIKYLKETVADGNTSITPTSGT